MDVSLYTRQNRRLVLRFVAAQPQVHYHLDWHPVAQWLLDPENIVGLLWQGKLLRGVMAFSPLHRQTTWLRLLALPFEGREEAFLLLWNTLAEILREQGKVVASMATYPWLEALLQGVGFTQRDTVINLVRPTQALPPFDLPPVKIRRLWFGEMLKVLAVDHAAFGAIWQMREADLREAGRRASLYTLAQDGKQIVGYQLSTRYGSALHLARLATLPEYQNRRIGSALVYKMLEYAQKTGVQVVTVNTQLSNEQSQRVYERFGFQRDEGNDLPIYSFEF